PEVEPACVVKADAYGHGAVEVSRVLVREGARWLAVSSVEEGVALRQAGVDARILVMADCFPFNRPALFECNLTPAVHSLDDLRDLNAYARAHGRRLAYHLKLDTGMGRLGTRANPDDIAAAIRDAPCLDCEGLMTHFASSSDYASAQTERQIACFDRTASALMAKGIAPRYLHMASTNPVAYGRHEAWRTMVRPGHALYGYISPVRGAAPERVLEVHPALRWKAGVLAVKDLPAGAAVGYGSMFHTQRATRIAILAVGYADGLSHRLGGRGFVIACGKLVPIVGAVSMDLTTIDVTDCPELKRGAAVTLLGDEGDVSINAQQMARMAGTISYDILCGIRTRVKRLYV
ncbi:MAG TPA: alanine racemase, partial [Bryobacteraceae bacterium]|nr:alanine racemase [Bryobacteraceae bacterium]